MGGGACGGWCARHFVPLDPTAFRHVPCLVRIRGDPRLPVSAAKGSSIVRQPRFTGASSLKRKGYPHRCVTGAKIPRAKALVGFSRYRAAQEAALMEIGVKR